MHSKTATAYQQPQKFVDYYLQNDYKVKFQVILIQPFSFIIYCIYTILYIRMYISEYIRTTYIETHKYMLAVHFINTIFSSIFLFVRHFIWQYLIMKAILQIFFVMSFLLKRISGYIWFCLFSMHDIAWFT